MKKKDKDINLDEKLEKAIREKKKKVKVGHTTMEVEQTKIGNRTFNIGTIKL